ncbi:hypothetical protein NEMBOFW57_001152 [Staphylotrichum longicolle]|uniref:Uncharacterized protein n=1 Tax=Staphylotrichum longicolle TaxID=669026 RepID=A0AAD4F145_9PEZI|nr:hypothetical protein NEMBOFW57_001152 [Staphylotrichum longicolle]
MPITLPVSTPSGPTGTTTTPPSHSNNPLHGHLTTLKSHLFRPLDLSTTRGKCAAATVVCRVLYGLVHSVLFGVLRKGSSAAWGLFYLIVDPVVVITAVRLIEAAVGGRRVFGRRIGEGFFDLFMVACGVVHVLYLVFLFFMVVSFAIFFGVTGGTFMTIVGAVILPVAVLALMPEDDGEGLGLP